MRIGVDIDDVLVDALPQFVAAFNARFAKAVPLEQADWDIFRVFPEIPHPARRAFWRTLEEERFLFQRPIHPEAAAAIRRLRDLGHDLFLVTGRLPWHRAPTLQWLAAEGLGEAFTDLLVKQPRLPREKHKRKAAAALRLEAFVEDERRTAEALVTLPLTVFLLDRPWNQGPALPGLTRVRDWPEILARVTTVSGNVRSSGAFSTSGSMSATTGGPLGAREEDPRRAPLGTADHDTQKCRGNYSNNTG
ncbi:MAG: hypothetical protein ACREJL_00475 [Candidatus Methylomirabilales bacterium]